MPSAERGWARRRAAAPLDQKFGSIRHCASCCPVVEGMSHRNQLSRLPVVGSCQAAFGALSLECSVDLLPIVGWRGAGRYGVYSSRVQQPWCMQGDAGGRMGTSDLLKQLVRMRLPVATDQKVGGSSPSERAAPCVTCVKHDEGPRRPRGPFSCSEIRRLGSSPSSRPDGLGVRC